MSERDDADFDYIAHDYDLEPDIGPEPRTGDHMSDKTAELQRRLEEADLGEAASRKAPA
jgi:hypothetical protein